MDFIFYLDTAIKFYGDPLVDFSLTHFLDRFAFKNPKKDTDQKPESLVQLMHHKHYTPHGSRGKSVKQLNAANVTEDEKFIFEYLNRKRERLAALGVSGDKHDDDVIDDDEFDAYLDSLGGKGKKNSDGIDDEEFDFVGDFGDGKKSIDGDDGDWDEDDDDDDGEEEDNNDGGIKSKKRMDDEYVSLYDFN